LPLYLGKCCWWRGPEGTKTPTLSRRCLAGWRCTQTMLVAGTRDEDKTRMRYGLESGLTIIKQLMSLESPTTWQIGNQRRPALNTAILVEQILAGFLGCIRCGRRAGTCYGLSNISACNITMLLQRMLTCSKVPQLHTPRTRRNL
jgi:hypothetical protein